MSQVATLQDIYQRNLVGRDDVELVVINSRGSEEGLPELTDGVTLPVLQDTTSDDVYGHYGATKWYMYFIGKDGAPHRIHYHMDLPEDEARFLSFIDELAGGGS